MDCGECDAESEAFFGGTGFVRMALFFLGGIAFQLPQKPALAKQVFFNSYTEVSLAHIGGWNAIPPLIATKSTAVKSPALCSRTFSSLVELHSNTLPPSNDSFSTRKKIQEKISLHHTNWEGGIAFPLPRNQPESLPTPSQQSNLTHSYFSLSLK